MWATINAQGHVVRTHSRENAARLNAGGLDVVEAPNHVASAANQWRYEGGQWVALDCPVSFRRIPANYSEARRAAYGQALETDKQFEAIVEALIVLFGDRPLPAKLATLVAEIAAIKAAHPKP